MEPLLPARPPANVVAFDDVDSTNEVASRLLAALDMDELSDTVLVAESQSAGRGRDGRVWASPPGGLYATWIGQVPVEALTLLPMSVGAVLARAVEAAAPAVRVGLKWPNDLMVAGRKLGGVLCQSRSSGGTAVVAAGFGVNLERPPSLGPGDAGRPTAVAEHAPEIEARVARVTILSAFIAGMRTALERPAEVFQAWSERGVIKLGEQVALRLPSGTVEGVFAGFDADGLLLLDIGGERRAIASGEVVAPL